MNFIAQVEEHLRDLGAEARKKHPGVKEASERAILQLRTLQNAYVTAVRKANQAQQDGSTSTEHPTTTLFQSQDLLRPFLLAANYPNASPKLLDIALRGMALLIKGNAICPGDGIHMVRVWTIQANVICSSGILSSSSDNKKSGIKGSMSQASSSTSSWFGMLSSAASATTESVVSSSTGGQGHHAPHPKKESSEKLALDLLRCLILLLEHEDGTESMTDEQWTASLALCCILGHVHVMVVQQAAKTSLHQVLRFLFRSESHHLHALETWRDLLILASQEPTLLKGAFSQCKSSAPSPTLCLELVCGIVRGNPTWLLQNLEEIEIESLQVSKLLLEQTTSVSFELVWRSYDFASALLTTVLCEDDVTGDEISNGEIEAISTDEGDDDDDDDVNESDECREDLVAALVNGIIRATEACRNNHDFEDGYAYNPSALGASSDTKTKAKSLVTLIPDSLLWRAGLALETIYKIIERSPLVIIAAVSEAISDFATIGASCRDHMLLLVECSQRCFKEDGNYSNMPSLFRRAEEIQSAALASQKLSENPKNLPSTSCDVGEALWIAFHCILELSRFVDDETSFAPSLAVLQHFLKRFPGSREIIHSTLLGYDRLAHIVESGSDLQRKALISSLCKLSLPSWGKHDASTQLQDHHIEALQCLLRIVHTYRDSMVGEWYMILGTFMELSKLNVASPKLSDGGYKGAVIVSTVFARIAPLTTILSVESLSAMLDALVEISKSSVDKRSGGASMVDSAVDEQDGRSTPKEESSIGGKLISFAGKAILGGDKQAENGKVGDTLKVYRIKTSYAADYTQEFQRRVSSSRALRGELLADLSLPLIVMTDIAMSNTFRFMECGSAISTSLCELAGSSTESREYALDLLSLLVTAQLSNDKPMPAGFVGPARVVSEDPSRLQFFQVTPDGAPQGLEEVSQVDLLSPLCDTIKFTKQAGVAEAGMSSLRTLLEGSGHNLEGDVWAIVIEAVSSLAGDASYEIDRTGTDWSGCCLLAFRGLKFVVDEYLDELPPPSADSAVAPRKALMECCSSFGSSRHDVNTSLTAIGLLWTIADQDADSSSIERALDKLVLLTADSRTEVRNCAANTLFSCIVGKGATFSNRQWERCICEVVFGVYDQVISRGGDTDTKADEKGQKEKYKTSVHHSRDSADKQWATTEVLVIQGLNRVLRNNFTQLLKTTGSIKVEIGKSASTGGVPWFVDVWSRILEIALHAAKRIGGRDTLDLRTTGVALIILCSQLSCRAGIQAAITPARVGTNMEVVNGALRSVGESKVAKVDEEKELSEGVGVTREELFVSSFKALFSFQQHLDADQDDNEDLKSVYLEPVQNQVLQGLAGGLSKLFDCCKEEELRPVPGAELPVLSAEVDVISTSDYEARFVTLITTVAVKAAGDQARFLSPGQRSALDLLRDMVANGSNRALKALSTLAGPAFFWISDSESNATADGGPEIEALSKEAAMIVSEEIKNPLLSDETKADILCILLQVFVEEYDNESWKCESTALAEPNRKRSYKLFMPVMEMGLSSALSLEATEHAQYSEFLDLLWEHVDRVLSLMLSPIHIDSQAPYISQATNLAELVKSAATNAPPQRQNDISALLCSGALKAIDIAKDHATQEGSTNIDGKVRSKKRLTEALNICRECMAGLCRVHPESSMLQAIAGQVFKEAIATFEEEKDGNETSVKNVNVEIAMIMCQAIRRCSQMENLVIALFPQLCLLMVVDHSDLRTELASLMETVNIGRTIADATARMKDAESRATVAESENELLVVAIEDLREQNSRLQRDIAVFSASSALS